MRTNQQLRDDLSRLTIDRMGFDLSFEDQQSDRWHTAKLGVISASRAKDVIAAGRTKGSVGEARNTYLLELIAEVATGQRKQITAKALEWGNTHEDSCVGLVGFELGAEIETIPFIYADDAMRYGCSPDGLIGDRSGIEAKNPFNTAVYLDFVLNGKIKPEYIEQVQFSMFVTGREEWIFANHDPRVKSYIMHSVKIERDEAKMATYTDAVGQFVYDMDQQLAKLGLTFGDQWSKPIF